MLMTRIMLVARIMIVDDRRTDVGQHLELRSKKGGEVME